MNGNKRWVWITAACLAFALGLAGGVLLQRYLDHRQPSRSAPGTAVSGQAAGSRVVTLDTRELRRPEDERAYDGEADSFYENVPLQVDLGRSALVLIDVWAAHPNDGFSERMAANRAEKLVPLLELARAGGISVVHALHGREPAGDCRPLPGELVIDPTRGSDDLEELTAFLAARGIETLFYAGYATNMCVLDRPVGIINLSRQGYPVILVRDCTVAFETAQTLEGEWAWRVAVDLVEAQWGSTTTLSDLQDAVAEAGE